MHLHLRAAHASLGFDLAGALSESGFGTVSVSVEPTDRFALLYKPGLTHRQISDLLEALAPFVPDEVAPSAELPPEHDASLWLGESGGNLSYSVRVHSDSAGYARKVGAGLLTRGYSPHSAVQEIQEDVVCWAGLSRFSQQVLRWHLSQLGFSTAWREDNNFYGFFGLFLRDPEQVSIPAGGRLEVEVACDDPDLGQALVAMLSQRGFSRCLLSSLTEYEAEAEPFTVFTGPFAPERLPTEYARLQGAVQEALHKFQIDPVRFPVQVDTSPRPSARIVAPLGAARAGRKCSAAGPYPDRFSITLVTDEPGAVESLQARLREVGFRKIQVQQRRSLLDGPDDGMAGEFRPGFAVASNEAAQHANLSALLMSVLRAEMAAIGANGFEPRPINSCLGDLTAVRIYFPVRGVADGTLLPKMVDATPYRLRLLTPKPDGYRSLLTELRAMKFAAIDFDTSTSDPTLYYGGAPLELINRLRGMIVRHAGREPTLSKQWDDNNVEIYLYLPERQPGAGDGVSAELPEEMSAQLAAWAFGEDGAEAVDSFIEVTPDRVRVGSVWLPRLPGPRHALAPHPSAFDHFCLDDLTAATLEHIATSVLLCEPCLLEGETSTSKTSSVLYLASLLNQPVARINLNGQTDTGELIGRFVPQHLTMELPLGEQELYAAADLLEAETRMILEKARREKRPLTPLEVQQVMAQEKMTSHPWRWQDGLIPQSLRQGWWVLLDEVNLAEPQILERLNSVLEADPALVMTENDNALIGRGGTPVHASFRIFGTMNPAEYAGRSVLSPAYRDRWRGYRFVPRPGEKEFLDMLHLLVFGEQPDFALHGRSYLGPEQVGRYARLADMPQIEPFLEALARFHVALENAVGQAPNTLARIGGRRKERYVFTRRGLLSMLDYLSSPLTGEEGRRDTRALRQGLLRYYLGRLSTGEDRAMVVQLLDAHGLGPNTWTFA